MQDDRPKYASTEVPEWFQAAPTPELVIPKPQQKNSKKLPLKRIFVMFLAVSIAVTIILGYLAYQSPGKVLSDGFGHLFNAQQLTTSGTITAEDDNFKITTSLDTQAIQHSGSATTAKMSFQPKTGADKSKTYAITLDAISQAGSNSYAKISNLKAPVNDFLSLYTSYYGIYGFYNPTDDPASITAANDPGTYQTELDDRVGQLVTKVDGQWIKVPVKSEGLENCQMSTYASLSDTTISHELITEYNKHPFLFVKSKSTKDGNYDYVMNYNSTAAQDFDMATPETKFGKQLSSCGGKESLFSIESDPLGFSSLQNGSVDISVSQWSHKIQSMHVKGNLIMGLSTVSIDVDLKFTYAAKPTLTTPATSTSIDDIEKNMETIDLSLSRGD